MDTAPHFGLTGLATMGANLARNVAQHEIPSQFTIAPPAGPMRSSSNTDPKGR